MLPCREGFSSMNLLKTLIRAGRDFAADARAAVTVELVLVVPLLIWAFFATMIFNDAYRARTQAQSAALHVADAVSRNTDMLTADYLEGMNDVYDFLIAGAETSRMRISSVAWDRDADQPIILWSYGTRGMTALPDNAFQLMFSEEWAALRAIMDGEDGDDLIAGFTQMPNTNLHTRIPPIMPGEALIVVESFTMWETPLEGVFLGFDILDDTRLSPIAVVRPRFSPFMNFEGAIEGAPPDASEFVGPDVDPTDDPADDPTDPTDTSDTPQDTVVLDDFATSDADGWSQADVTTSNDGSIGGYLGPFGRETMDAPVSFAVNLGGDRSAARVEFDLYLFDSWDGFDPNWSPDGGEQLWIGVEDTSIAAEAFQVNPSGLMRATRGTTASRDEGLFTTRMELVDAAANIDGGGWPDQVWRVTIDITDPQSVFDLSFRMLSDEPRDNESFGIDNFSINATSGQQTGTHVIPSQRKLRTDPYSGFQNFRGCPDPQIAARTHHATQTSLAASGSALRHKVDAGGRQDLTRCNGLDLGWYDEGFFNANPTVVFHWDNEGLSGAGNRLRIRTDDGNRGQDCDSVLAVSATPGVNGITAT